MYRRGRNGVSTTGFTANFMLFDGGTVWLLPFAARDHARRLQQ